MKAYFGCFLAFVYKFMVEYCLQAQALLYPANGAANSVNCSIEILHRIRKSALYVELPAARFPGLINSQISPLTACGACVAFLSYKQRIFSLFQRSFPIYDQDRAS
jgi:hypothetical protein